MMGEGIEYRPWEDLGGTRSESALALDDPARELHRIEATIDFPGPIPRAAQDYFDRKSLQPEFDWDAVWGIEHVAAFTAAKLVEVAVLQDVQDAVSEAIRDGLPFEQFVGKIDKKTGKPVSGLAAKLAAKGWWGEKTVTDPKTGRAKTIRVDPQRLYTIFDTNLRTARAAGQWERIQRTKATRPALRYVLGPSERHRPEHVALEGTILPVDDPAWGAIMPPNGFRCKCSVIQTTQRDVDRRGGYSKHEDVVDRINRERTREADAQWRRAARRAELKGKPPPVRKPPPVATDITEGADPAFRTNPGATRLAGLR